MAHGKKAVWVKWIWYCSAIVLATCAGLVVYLKTPLPQVDVPNEQQPPFPRPVPHSIGSLPYAESEWPSVHGGPANNDYVAIEHGVEFTHEWQALLGMATIVAPVTGPEGNIYQTTGNPPGGF